MPSARRKAAWRHRHVALMLFVSLAAALPAQVPVLNETALAQRYFGNDAPWYLDRIPFLEIDDPELQRIYYYRWQIYRSHLREIGPQGTDVTEFLPDVPWARHPYTDLNDSSSFHILEGRWLRDRAPVTSLVDHLYTGGGNDRHFSESVAAATLAWTEVTGDPAPALRHLDAMQHVYNLWDDHFDAARNLYWVEPIADATEYTISSIDASGAGFTDQPSKDQARNGFFGGFAFRPTINAFQFGNAEAIATLAMLAHQPEVAREYTARAEALRTAVLGQLWNPALGHFTDIYQRSTKTVHAGEFIRGRELAGMVPWQFNLPPQTPAPEQPVFNTAWMHVLDAQQLAGPYGLRTVEPTYPRYMAQYRYDAATGLPECQWNGPAWPFQISQTLSGMANLLQSPQHGAVTADDYVRLLRQYAHMHLDAADRPDLQEDYNPDTGKPIVGLPRSHHYNHSTFNDLLLSGLLGIRPTLEPELVLHPLLPSLSGARPIRFFVLQHLRYHGRDLTVLYDADGTHFHRGAGVSVYAEGRRIYGPRLPGLAHIPLRPGAPSPHSAPVREDLAVNVWERPPSAHESTLPIATASSSAPGTSPYQAIDGRLWFFPEILNGWSPDPSTAGGEGSWLALDLRRVRRVHAAELAFFADAQTMDAPAQVELQVWRDGAWQPVSGQHLREAAPVPNGITHLDLPVTGAQQLRLLLHPRPGRSLRLIEWKLF